MNTHKMNITKISAFILSLFIFTILGSALISAATTTPRDPRCTGEVSSERCSPATTTITLGNPFKFGSSIFGLLKAVIDNILMPIGGVLAVMGFIWTGFLFVLAQGRQKVLDDAKRALVYTSVGTVILFGAWGIAKVIENTINQLR
jgi:hypothetical protein